ncbi:carbohydrate ABC transporter permease [Arthrobacter sp. B2a2-09]|uniref:carbohydrate ABC transporter permease n=1 Tax=Arthrobacter sp. B2a2-09 TaxID=2952822 RepID=UPI0022CDA723|nr:carbohydrate ABC transporter permease [Arthrobacter sp. B2a2-09]MCZ9883666.1 carbohydrate ABC transporter permease [Arthrobacter sp. B2a2-09]
MIVRALRSALVWALALLWLMPVYLMVVNSMTPAKQYSGNPAWMPTGLAFFQNLSTAWTDSGFGDGLLNSLMYSLSAAALAVLAAALAGYAVVIMPLKRPTLWFWLIYLGTLLPLQIFLAPLFKAYVAVGLYDTNLGMILIYAAICVPFAFFIVRNYLSTLPTEITEAAQLDGASWATVFWRIHFPLIRSSLLAAFIFQFTWVWNDLLFGITLTTSPDRRPVMAALAEVSGGFASLGPPVTLAAAIVASFPTVVLFIACQRFFVSSLKAVG